MGSFFKSRNLLELPPWRQNWASGLAGNHLKINQFFGRKNCGVRKFIHPKIKKNMFLLKDKLCLKKECVCLRKDTSLSVNICTCYIVSLSKHFRVFFNMSSDSLSHCHSLPSRFKGFFPDWTVCSFNHKAQKSPNPSGCFFITWHQNSRWSWLFCSINLPPEV